MGLYRRLVEFHKNGELSFKYVKTFNMDEYVGNYHKSMNLSGLNAKIQFPSLIEASIVLSYPTLAAKNQ